MRRRCSLCGGKLNGNICTECGLDNSKNDDQYVTLENSGHEESLTHVHTEEEKPYEKCKESSCKKGVKECGSR